MVEGILYYFCIINAAAFLLYGFDKYAAIHHYWRISEKTLLMIAVLGGSVGAILAMMLFRHKTKKAKFTITIPLLIGIQWIIINHMI